MQTKTAIDPLKSIAEELANCRAAFAAYPNVTWAWCCHHEVLCEKLTEPAENRIAYIISNKPKSEHAIRFRNFRPVKDEKSIEAALAEYEKICDAALAEYEKIRDAALAEYEKVRGAARAEYDKVCGPALAEYEKVRCAAWAEYEKIRDALHNAEWPDNSWDGRSIGV